MAIRAPRITSVTRHLVRVPFRSRCAPWNALLVDSWQLLELLHVETEDPDVSGWGEAVVSYTATTVTQQAMGRLVGANPAEHLWDPSVGIALQMALFDTVGHTLDVPIARLLNLPQVRTSAPIAWWSTKMPPEVLAADAAEAVEEGYLAHKFKARPWFDVVEQVRQISEVTPEHFQLDIDFNRMLIDRGTAAPLLAELDTYSRVGLYEAPLAEGQFDEYRLLRGQVQRPLVEHFDQGPFRHGALAGSYDGHVFSPNTVGNGVGSLLRQGILAEEFGRSGWIQMVGTGLTTALVLQVSSVLPAARWPFVTAMNIYTDDLVSSPIEVTAGQAIVPSGAGLGVEIDRDAVERFRVSEDFVLDRPAMILTLILPGERRRIYASMSQLWQDCRIHGNVPLTGRGARLAVRWDDGSDDFAGDHRQLQEAPRWQQ